MVGKVRIIKNLPAYIMIIALLLIYLFNAAHADCAEDALCDNAQVVALADIEGEQDSDQKNALYDCCATSHYADVSVTGTLKQRISLAINGNYQYLQISS